ncbi:hypothetical protein Pelo_4002 [Pelomyxa schiedti]|nr:hypothetical protein Pelo_4002 [Pelomyxa schiedti]
MPPAYHVLWARDQFVALCSGGIVGRCASVSPLRVIPHHVLCHEIGRNWIMGVRDSVVVGSRDSVYRQVEATWFVSVSHTLGVVDVERQTKMCTKFIYGWVDRDHFAAPVPVELPSHSVIAELETEQEVARWDGTFDTRNASMVRNKRWQLVYAADRKSFPMWPRPKPLTGSSTGRRPSMQFPVRVVSIGELEAVNWIDVMVGRHSGNSAVVSVTKRGGNRALWIVDLAKTYQQGVFSIIQEFHADTCYSFYWSDKYTFLAAPQVFRVPCQRDIFLVNLETNNVIRKCTSFPIKVDECHFCEFDCGTDTLRVFSNADGWVAPCSVFHLADTAFKVDNGLIAVQRRDYIALLDALTALANTVRLLP